MKFANSIKLSVFSYPEEDSGKIKEAFLSFFPFSLDEKKIPLKKTNATGFNERKIEIFEAILAKQNLVRQFLENLLDKMTKAQKEIIAGQIESRLDENLDFFIRFDKGEWTVERKLCLTDSGKCFHLKISISAFPKKREIAACLVKELLKNEKA